MSLQQEISLDMQSLQDMTKDILLKIKQASVEKEFCLKSVVHLNK
jgi:hypothetical protein